ncbi:MAG: succinate dehydrogenase, cytochrome b556 subunit [Gammaproteobacteria bacterium]
MNLKQKRPKFLNLFAIHLPVTGVISFAHRVSGALMILAIPGLIYLFGLSLRDQAGYVAALAMLHTWPLKLILSILVWTLSHHILAGIRFLLMDVNLGEQLTAARLSAWAVNVAGALVFLFMLYRIWL